MQTRKVYLPEIVGKGYGKFWNFKGRYRIVKGSRASKKSKTIALWYIVNMMAHKEANTLVVRRVYATLKDSCYTDLKWACKRLGVEKFWDFKSSPLEATYKPTGQKILFRGLDDPYKVTSIAVDTGVLCWLWVEEAYEVLKEEDFDTLNESIRGVVPKGLFKQATLSFNPWSDRHWIKARFFDVVGEDCLSEDGNILAMTTTYKCNEWLDEADLLEFERMRIDNPRRYKVAGLGDWGIAEGLIYENYEVKDFNIEQVRKDPNTRAYFGLDFGYTTDPTALACLLVDEVKRIIYVFDELYEQKLTNEGIYLRLKAMGYAKERITADSAEPKSIAELFKYGLTHIEPARKGKDSIRNGIQYVQRYKLVIHPRCTNFEAEVTTYAWAKDKFGVPTGEPTDKDNHLMDALRYALEKLILGKNFDFS